MKQKRKLKKFWVAVKVERGFICKAKVFDSIDLARQTEHRWRSHINPDYDETAVLESC
jgi:hypothetical protein